jgi:hypothetical protein
MCVYFAGNSSVQRRMPMDKPQICVSLQRSLLGFASAFTKRNVEGNVRSITRDHISAFAGQNADEGKGKA